MVAQDYPVTQPYGYDPTYPLNGGFHKGVDYGCPDGTPVVVNGVTIGLSGHTGAVTGPHLHVGRFVNGKDTDPGNGGFQLDNAIVFDTGYDPTNGNFVRINGSGALWVYLHLSQINVKKGQELKGDDMFEGKSAEEWAAIAKDADRYKQSVIVTQGWKRADVFDQDVDRVDDAIDDLIVWKDKAINELQPQIKELQKQLNAEATPLKPGKYSVN